jgi:hypothetical protein
MAQLEEVQYAAKAHTTGGRDVTFSSPSTGTNPG